jgi:hypothetical protein
MRFVDSTLIQAVAAPSDIKKADDCHSSRGLSDQSFELMRRRPALIAAL